jgi:predicted  nucleic acid-binding Zn-ribbon protein
MYEDEDVNIMRGCARCGGIFFLYTTKGVEDTLQLDAVKKELEEKDTTLENEIIKQIEKKKATKRKKPKIRKVRQRKTETAGKKEIIEVGSKKFAIEGKFDIETVREPIEGVYQINIEALMKNNPLIVFERKKIYVIHLPDVFEKTNPQID